MLYSLPVESLRQLHSARGSKMTRTTRALSWGLIAASAFAQTQAPRPRTTTPAGNATASASSSSARSSFTYQLLVKDGDVIDGKTVEPGGILGISDSGSVLLAVSVLGGPISKTDSNPNRDPA